MKAFGIAVLLLSSAASAQEVNLSVALSLAPNYSVTKVLSQADAAKILAVYQTKCQINPVLTNGRWVAPRPCTNNEAFSQFVDRMFDHALNEVHRDEMEKARQPINHRNR